MNAGDEQKFTPLHMAALKGNVDYAKFLIKKHANVDARLKDGSTSLFIAAENGYSNFVEILLDNGADANIRGSNDLTPLEIAQKTGKTEVVNILTKHTKQGNLITIFYSIFGWNFTHSISFFFS